MNFVAIDFETANNRRDSACAVGLVRVVDSQIVDQAVHLIRPPTDEFLFSHIHGIRWKDVAKAPDFGDLWPSISSFIEGAEFFAAHNAPFDKGVLNACCSRYDVPMPKLPFQCSVKVARSAFNIYPTKLSDVCRTLGIDLDHHEALSDAMACAKILIAANDTLKPKTIIRRRPVVTVEA